MYKISKQTPQFRLSISFKVSSFLTHFNSQPSSLTSSSQTHLLGLTIDTFQPSFSVSSLTIFTTSPSFKSIFYPFWIQSSLTKVPFELESKIYSFWSTQFSSQWSDETLGFCIIKWTFDGSHPMRITSLLTMISGSLKSSKLISFISESIIQ